MTWTPRKAVLVGGLALLGATFAVSLFKRIAKRTANKLDDDVAEALDDTLDEAKDLYRGK